MDDLVGLAVAVALGVVLPSAIALILWLFS